MEGERGGEWGGLQRGEGKGRCSTEPFFHEALHEAASVMHAVAILQAINEMAQLASIMLIRKLICQGR